MIASSAFSHQESYEAYRAIFQKCVQDKDEPQSLRFFDIIIDLQVIRERGKNPNAKFYVRPAVLSTKPGENTPQMIAENAGGAAAFLVGYHMGHARRGRK